jgi:hypothetical protein
LLDARAGIQYEGETAPHPNVEQQIHMRAYSLLANGMGAFDWAGLPYVVALLGVDDPEALIHALQTIKTHRPNTAPGQDT